MTETTRVPLLQAAPRPPGIPHCLEQLPPSGLIEAIPAADDPRIHQRRRPPGLSCRRRFVFAQASVVAGRMGLVRLNSCRLGRCRPTQRTPARQDGLCSEPPQLR